MVTILSNCLSTSTLTKPCIAVPVMDRRSGAILVSTTFTHQTMLWINKLLSPTVALLTLSPRGTQLVIVHSLPEKASSLRLILKCFTRQLLEVQIILAYYFKFLVSGATEKAGVRRVGSGRENWRERPCFSLPDPARRSLPFSVVPTDREPGTDYWLYFDIVTAVL